MSGWSAADQQAADLLARHDMLVVGVDTARYAATLAGISETCHHLDGDAEAISHQLQREQAFERLFHADHGRDGPGRRAGRAGAGPGAVEYHRRRGFD